MRSSLGYKELEEDNVEMVYNYDGYWEIILRVGLQLVGSLPHPTTRPTQWVEAKKSCSPFKFFDQPLIKDIVVH